jgi:acyl dehydratase
MTIAELSGTDIGTRTVRYEAADAALYALAVGADPSDLRLVYERDLRVLPTYAAALGIWATAEAARIGGYDETKVLHVSQSVLVRHPLPVESEFEARARVANVFDKGSAALVHVLVESEFFDATYVMFVAEEGGWGGDRGPSARIVRVENPVWEGQVTIATNAAALYRLTGDRHPVHIDAAVARANGYRGPILHGLCTFGTVVREVSTVLGVDPTSITDIDANFLAPVFPGDVLDLRVEHAPDEWIRFEARVDDKPVLSGAFVAGEQPDVKSGSIIVAVPGAGT